MVQTLQYFDVWLFNALRPWDAPWLDTGMSWYTLSGAMAGVWACLALIGLSFQRSRAAAWRVILAVSLSMTLVELVLKPAFERARPAAGDYTHPRDLPGIPTSPSFPSGHASSAFAAVTAIARMWPRGRVVWWTLAALMAYSRIYVGHHYPSDVLAGAMFGLLIALWVLGGRHGATFANTLTTPLPGGAEVRP